MRRLLRIAGEVLLMVGMVIVGIVVGAAVFGVFIALAVTVLRG